MNRKSASQIGGLAVALCLACTAYAQVNVTTWHNDTARTGADTNETILTPANVGAASFGQVFSVPVDGEVFAEPLYLSGLDISGGTHNVLFVATENDSVYAIDADTGTVYWQRSFLGPGMTTVPSSLMSCDDIVPQLGITGTPVIDPTTGTLYVVSTSEPGPIQQLHAISVYTGADMPDSPVTITASVPGNGAASSGGTLAFDPTAENQRSALLLTNGHIVIAWGSHCDHPTFHGWLMSYNAATLAQEAVLNITPNGVGGGIWMSGGAPAVDANGNIFVASSNGDFGGPTVTEFSDAILKMPQPVAAKSWLPIDGFAPWNQNTMNQFNEDLGASAVLLLPDLPAGTPHQQMLIEASKNGEIFLVDRNNMGRYCASCANGQLDTNIVQELPSQLPNPMTGSPAYWDETLYFGGPSASLKAFSFNTTTGALSPQPVQTSAYTFAGRGPTISVSANGNSNGIVWAVDSRPYGEVLLAYDATNLSHLLYQTTIGSTAVRFEVPMVANGKVYIGTPNSVVAFGLNSATITTPPVTLTFAQNPITPTTAAGYSVTVGAGTAGQPNPIGTITLYGVLPSGQTVQADGPHAIGTAGTAGTSTYSGTLPSGIPAGQYTVYATFQPASGSSYGTANSPQVMLVSQ